MTAAEAALQFSGAFEAEVLTELLLRHWNHPRASHRNFRNNLLESAAEALRLVITGQVLIEGLPAEHTNLIAAIWYVEWSSVQDIASRNPKIAGPRQQWLDSVRRALPSCFCHPNLLDPNRLDYDPEEPDEEE